MVKLSHHTSLRERFNISRLAISHPRLMIGFWIAVMVAGVLAFSSLKYALFPDITYPVVVVNASAPLPTALATEAKLTQPLEQQLRSLQAIDEVRSSTYPGQTTVSLSFAVGTDLEKSNAQVKTALKQIHLPKGTDSRVIPLNLNESSVITYAIQSHTRSLAELTQITQKQILPNIARLPGVLKVVLLGTSSSTSPTESAASGIVLAPGTTAARFNGRDALAFQVIKRGKANTLEVVSQVEKIVQQLRDALPDVQLNLAATQARYIREAIQAMLEALALAVVLSVVVIFAFLRNWQATLISALAIPASLLGTFIAMATFGFNLETITLLAMVLVIGIIVDDAIVDVENIIRHVENGESPRKAAISATNEIGLTVTAATLTIVAVFLPVGLMGGVIGQFFKPFGLTVSAAVLTSLLVARTLSPLLSVYWLKPMPRRRGSLFLLAWVQRYRNLLSWSLNHRGTVLRITLLIFVFGISLLPLVPKGFIPQLDRGEFNVTYTAPASTSLSESRSIAQQLEAFIRRSDQVETVLTTVGSRQGEPNQGNLYVKLKSDHTIRTPELEDQFRRSLPAIPQVTTSVEDIQLIDTGDDKPLQVTLIGDNLSALAKTAAAIKAQIQHLPGFADVTVTGEANKAGQILEIEHLNSRRVASISANLTNNLALGDATNQVVAKAKALMPPTVSLDLGGDSARISEILGSFGRTLGLSVLCILVVLISLFRSWVAPLAIIFSLPLSLAGAMLALLVSRSEFGVISAIGIIFLFGLTNKNAILLVDYINQLRNSGLTRSEAILKAGPVRLRPILMTTAATILGMLPIAVGLGAGSELRSPMAIAIIGGLITSTLLSLIVVPVVYSLLEDWQLRIFQGKKFG
ncbi:MAG: efflux RND transporter permease subunit [Chroococcidiopsidaceae cyanobacterium CP_BM_RX_35]|nr:efflux RND transporter permease subunit [Chroococcidiopsidaceae cyanobacterium CP_BM_RX_35]